MYYVVTFTEGEFHGIRQYADEDQASAFGEGFMAGGGAYGAGSCAAYVYPAEEDEMRYFHSVDVIEAALVEIAKAEDKRNG